MPVSVVREITEKEFEDLLSSSSSVRSKISETLKAQPEASVFLLIVDLKSYQTCIVETVRLMQSLRGFGVYFTVNKPFADLSQHLSSKSIDSSKIFFIDAISSILERSGQDSPGAAFLDSPTDLIEVNNAISKSLSAKKAGFVLVDSLSTLLLYNKPMAVERFVHSLVGKIRGERCLGFLVAVKSAEHSGFVETVSQFVDCIIEI